MVAELLRNIGPVDPRVVPQAIGVGEAVSIKFGPRRLVEGRRDARLVEMPGLDKVDRAHSKSLAKAVDHGLAEEVGGGVC